jgi:hypothetical protein
MPRPLSHEQQLEIGRAVRIARRGHCPWKLLEGTYHRTRRQLHRYARLAANEDVTSPQMSHLRYCGAESRAV